MLPAPIQATPNVLSTNVASPSGQLINPSKDEESVDFEDVLGLATVVASQAAVEEPPVSNVETDEVELALDSPSEESSTSSFDRKDFDSIVSLAATKAKPQTNNLGPTPDTNPSSTAEVLEPVVAQRNGTPQPPLVEEDASEAVGNEAKISGSETTVVKNPSGANPVQESTQQDVEQVVKDASLPLGAAPTQKSIEPKSPQGLTQVGEPIVETSEGEIQESGGTSDDGGDTDGHSQGKPENGLGVDAINQTSKIGTSETIATAFPTHSEHAVTAAASDFKAVERSAEPTVGAVGSSELSAELFTQRLDSKAAVNRTVAANEVPIAKQVANHIVSARLEGTKGKQHLEIRLDPPHLGSISVEIVDTNDKLVAKVTAADPAAFQALQSNASNLFEAFEQAGIEFEEFTFGQQHSDAEQRSHERQSSSGGAAFATTSDADSGFESARQHDSTQRLDITV